MKGGDVKQAGRRFAIPSKPMKRGLPVLCMLFAVLAALLWMRRNPALDEPDGSARETAIARALLEQSELPIPPAQARASEDAPVLTPAAAPPPASPLLDDEESPPVSDEEVLLIHGQWRTDETTDLVRSFSRPRSVAALLTP